jgi:hypothetical protein
MSEILNPSIQSKQTISTEKMTRDTTIKTLFLAWQDYQSRSWFPIGRLTFDGKKYRFSYIQGVKDAQEQCGFKPLFSFPELEAVYESDYLFPVFANRLMSAARPEYKNFLNRLNLPENTTDLMLMLARSEGKRETDSLQVFPYPEVDDLGRYCLHFFAHGLRHLPDCAINRINALQVGEMLWLSHEFQNPYDSQALILTTADHYIIGYCPRFLTSYIFDILRSNPFAVEVKVDKINALPNPLQFRLLCRMTYSVFDDLEPFSQDQYQPIRIMSKV